MFTVRVLLSVYKEFHRSMMTQLQINYLYTLTSVILHHPVLLKRFQADWEELDESDILGRVTALIPDIKKEELKFCKFVCYFFYI